MGKKINVTMGGYLDENGKLMDRSELNRCIAAIKKENTNLKKQVEKLKECVEFYGDEMNWRQRNSINGKYNLGKIWVGVADSPLSTITTENGARAREVLKEIEEMETSD